MKDLLGRPKSFRLTMRLYAHLNEPRVLTLPTESRPTGKVRGILNLSNGETRTKKDAMCEFEIDSDWMSKPPKVNCFESWIKVGANWHVYEDSSLCYVLGDLWRDFLRDIEKKMPLELDDLAACWCVANVKSLLYRHYRASELRLTTWPSEWDFWGHGDKGRQEYELSKRRG
jgi:hypothetical protein